MRTVLKVEVVVETSESMPPAEHAKRVGWVRENILKAQQYVQGNVYTVTVVRDANGQLVSFSGYGATPSEETSELIAELTNEGKT